MNVTICLANRIPKAEFIKIVEESTSCASAMRKMGYNCTTGRGSIAVRRRISELGLNISHWTNLAPRKTLKAEEVFTISVHSNHTIKDKVIKLGLIPYECGICGNKGSWNGKKLVLQLDHINGNHQDNRIENLRLLCPNCHSQTDNFAGKNSSMRKSKVRNKLRQD